MCDICVATWRAGSRSVVPRQMLAPSPASFDDGGVALVLAHRTRRPQRRAGLSHPPGTCAQLLEAAHAPPTRPLPRTPVIAASASATCRRTFASTPSRCSCGRCWQHHDRGASRSSATTAHPSADARHATARGAGRALARHRRPTDDDARGPIIKHDAHRHAGRPRGPHRCIHGCCCFGVAARRCRRRGSGTCTRPGLRRRDYRICDRAYRPARADRAAAIRSGSRGCRHSQWCYAPLHGTDVAKSPRRTARRTGVVFGSFNQFWKISETCVDLWARDPAAARPTRNSRVVGVPQGSAADALRARVRAARHRGGPHRILAPAASTCERYFAAIRARRHRARHDALQRRDDHARHAVDGRAGGRARGRPTPWRAVAISILQHARTMPELVAADHGRIRGHATSASARDAAWRRALRGDAARRLLARRR